MYMASCLPKLPDFFWRFVSCNLPIYVLITVHFCWSCFKHGHLLFAQVNFHHFLEPFSEEPATSSPSSSRGRAGVVSKSWQTSLPGHEFVMVAVYTTYARYIDIDIYIYCLVRGYISYRMISEELWYFAQVYICWSIHSNLQTPDRWQMLFPLARMISTGNFFNLLSNSGTHTKFQNRLRNRWRLRMARSPARAGAAHEGEGLLAGATVGWIHLAWFRMDTRSLIAATFGFIVTLGLWNHNDLTMFLLLIQWNFSHQVIWLSNFIVVLMGCWSLGPLFTWRICWDHRHICFFVGLCLLIYLHNIIGSWST